MLPVTSPRTLGQALRYHRKKLQLSQTEAGQRINLTQKMVSNIENGVAGVRLGTLFNYMAALGLEIHLEPRDKGVEEEAPW